MLFIILSIYHLRQFSSTASLCFITHAVSQCLIRMAKITVTDKKSAGLMLFVWTWYRCMFMSNLIGTPLTCLLMQFYDQPIIKSGIYWHISVTIASLLVAKWVGLVIVLTEKITNLLIAHQSLDRRVNKTASDMIFWTEKKNMLSLYSFSDSCSCLTEVNLDVVFCGFFHLKVWCAGHPKMLFLFNMIVKRHYLSFYRFPVSSNHSSFWSAHTAPKTMPWTKFPILIFNVNINWSSWTEYAGLYALCCWMWNDTFMLSD